MKSIIFSAVLMMIVSFCRAQVVLKSDSCQVPSMMFGDTIRTGQPFSKDPPCDFIPWKIFDVLFYSSIEKFGMGNRYC